MVSTCDLYSNLSILIICNNCNEIQNLAERIAHECSELLPPSVAQYYFTTHKVNIRINEDSGFVIVAPRLLSSGIPRGYRADHIFCFNKDYPERWLAHYNIRPPNYQQRTSSRIFDIELVDETLFINLFE